MTWTRCNVDNGEGAIAQTKQLLHFPFMAVAVRNDKRVVNGEGENSHVGVSRVGVYGCIWAYAGVGGTDLAPGPSLGSRGKRYSMACTCLKLLFLAG